MRGARGDQASLGWLRLWAQSALKGEEKEKSTGTEAIRTSASSYRDLRTRSRRDGCCRHFPAYPEDLRSPGGVWVFEFFLKIREPPTRGDPKPNP